MAKKYFLMLLAAGILSVTSCKKDRAVTPTIPQPPEEQPEPEPAPDINTIPEFYMPAPEAEYGNTAPDLTLIADASSAINKPADLDFHPLRENELWVLNHDNVTLGGSTVTFTAVNDDAQRKADHRRDANSWHFMSLPTAMAFNNNGNWATSNGVLDANHDGTPWTGPTLWSGNLDVYAKPSGGNGSHLDMVHQSPYGMGIAGESNNAYWVFDGYNGNIVRYDFVHDHGPGMHDHSDAIVQRYTEAKVKRSDIPSHMILDRASGWLYVVVTAEKKIYRLNTLEGSKYQDLAPYFELVAEYSEIRGATWEVFAEGSLQKPCGIDIKDNRLFVSDNATGDIIAFDLNTRTELGRISTGKPGIMGIKVGPNGKIWYVNSESNELYRIDPK